MGAIFLTAAVAAVVYVFAIWEAFAIQTLWAWFVVPQFGLPALSMAHAVGLAVLAGLFAKQYVKPSKELDWGVFAYAVMKPALALFVGWIAKSFL